MAIRRKIINHVFHTLRLDKAANVKLKTIIIKN